MVGQPLLNLERLVERQDAVQWLFENSLARHALASTLQNISDLERIINRIDTNIALPREVVALRKAWKRIPELITILKEYNISPSNKE